jgi:NAD(P)-dependent dehydrogenase (short-subunit alcohol dehydrogenase family)
MKVMVIGATGTIGKEVAALLEQGHEVVRVGHRGGDAKVDIGSKDSIEALFDAVGPVDAVVSTAGNASFASFDALSDADFQLALDSKLMGQVNLARIGARRIAEGGSITLTGGVLAHRPIPGSVAVSLANGALESFVKAAAGEAGRGVRINLVSPAFVKETMVMMGMDPTPGVSAADTAKAYKLAVEGTQNGETLAVTQ